MKLSRKNYVFVNGSSPFYHQTDNKYSKTLKLEINNLILLSHD